MRLFLLASTLFLLCFSLEAQNDGLESEVIDDTSPLYIPTEGGFVYFIAEEGKVIFAQKEIGNHTIKDSMIDLTASEGRFSISVDEDTTHYTYNLVDVNGVFNPTRRTNPPKATRYYRPPYAYKRITNYDPAQNMDGTHVTRVHLPYGVGIQNISYSLRERENYFGRYKQSAKELVEYQFSVFDDKFAFYTSNSSHIIVFDQLGKVLALSTLIPTEPFIYSKKHQSIYYDEVQQQFYLVNTTNFGYNWYTVDPVSGTTKLVKQIKKLTKDPGWWVMDGTLHYTLTEDSTTTIFDVPLY